MSSDTLIFGQSLVPIFMSVQKDGSWLDACKKYRESVHRSASFIVTIAACSSASPSLTRSCRSCKLRNPLASLVATGNVFAHMLIFAGNHVGVEIPFFHFIS